MTPQACRANSRVLTEENIGARPDLPSLIPLLDGYIMHAESGGRKLDGLPERREVGFAGYAGKSRRRLITDGDDCQLFESCASGPGIPRSSGCENQDLDNDNDVDQADFAVFQRCFSGPDVPADPSCVT